MKQINKNSWQARLIKKVYDLWQPKNTCQYYFHIFVAMFCVPFIWYANYLAYSFTCACTFEEARKVDKWHNTRWSLLMTIVLWILLTMVALFLLVIVGKVFSFEFKLSSVQFVCLSISAWLFGPIIIRGFIELYKKVRDKFCKPVEFI